MSKLDAALTAGAIVGGCVAVEYGLWLAWEPAAWIVGGIAAITIGINPFRSRSVAPTGRPAK